MVFSSKLESLAELAPRLAISTTTGSSNPPLAPCEVYDCVILAKLSFTSCKASELDRPTD